MEEIGEGRIGEMESCWEGVGVIATRSGKPYGRTNLESIVANG